MADDREVLREIWEGKVPVCFSLAPNECAGTDNPEPLYVSTQCVLKLLLYVSTQWTQITFQHSGDDL